MKITNVGFECSWAELILIHKALGRMKSGDYEDTEQSELGYKAYNELSDQFEAL